MDEVEEEKILVNLACSSFSKKPRKMEKRNLAQEASVRDLTYIFEEYGKVWTCISLGDRI